tara:strand:- start:478 stop:1530 length:1053 start_codon:yes stop_codon:yes gene_type:complete
MAIKNNYSGFTLASTTEFNNADNDSDFGVNLNRNIQKVNSDYSIAAGVRNTFIDGYINQFGASARFSTNEQRLIQNMIRESININGITVRYMPRSSPYTDNVWNERPESRFHRGLQMDMLLVAAAGFEGEGDVMTTYGIEFREEVILSVAINNFENLYNSFDSDLKSNGDSEDAIAFERSRPLEGDLIVIPFGRSAQNKNQYIPKVFEILRVTTYHDGAFFQIGDNYQYKLRCRLFELSGEDLEFNPTVVEYKKDGTQLTLIDSDTGPIARAKTGLSLTDSDTKNLNIADDSDDHFDTYADNRDIEERSQKETRYDNRGEPLKEKATVISKDYTAEAFGYAGIINSLDDI